MARINNLSNFLTDVATAIKNKKGSQTAIPAANFDTEISNLPSQGVYQHKQVTVVDNGSVTVLPDTGYDAIDQLDVTVTIPLQQKTYTFTQNTTTTIIPEQGYAGFSQVGLEINVPSGSGDVKLFDTIEHMQESSGNTDGDLAVVYDNTIDNITVNSTLKSVVFANVVTLSTAVSSTIQGYWTSDDSRLNGRITASMARFTNYDDYSYVTYTSSDGITYTRTDSLGNPITFNTELTYDTSYYEWNDIFSSFMQTAKNEYNGLYVFKEDYIDKDTIRFPSLTGTRITYDTSTSTSSMSFDGTYVATYSYSQLYNFAKVLHDRGVINSTGTALSINYFINNNNELCFAAIREPNALVNFTLVFNTQGILLGIKGESSDSGTARIYKITDLDNIEYEQIDSVVLSNPISTSYNYGTYTNIKSAMVHIYSTSTQEYANMYVYLSSTSYATINNNTQSQYYQINSIYDTFIAAPTQLTLEESNQLLSGKIAYGKNGVVVGNDNFYTDINLAEVISKKTSTPIYTKGTYIYTNYENLNGVETVNANADTHFNNGVCTFEKITYPFTGYLGTYTEHYNIRMQSNTTERTIIVTIYDEDFNVVDTINDVAFTYTSWASGSPAISMNVNEGGNYLYLLFNENGAYTASYKGPNHITFIKYNLLTKTYTKQSVEFSTGWTLLNWDCDDTDCYILGYNGHYYDSVTTKVNKVYKNFTEIASMSFTGQSNIIDTCRLYVTPNYVYIIPNRLYNYGTYKVGVYNKSTSSFSNYSLGLSGHSVTLMPVIQLNNLGQKTGNIAICRSDDRKVYTIGTSSATYSYTLSNDMVVSSFSYTLYTHINNGLTEYIFDTGEYYNISGNRVCEWKDLGSSVTLSNRFTVYNSGRFIGISSQSGYRYKYELRFDLAFSNATTNNFLIDCNDDQHTWLFIDNDNIIKN